LLAVDSIDEYRNVAHQRVLFDSAAKNSLLFQRNSHPHGLALSEC